MKELISHIKNEYLIEFEEVETGKDNINDIKLDFEKLSEYYVSAFNEFRAKILSYDGKHKELIRDIVKAYGEISLNIIKFSQYKTSQINYGKSQDKIRLSTYMEDNYYDIVDFVDMFIEVSE